MPSVAIIGAGPAGSSAAISLARSGFRVALFEARPFPRIKVCGEFISPSAGPALESLIPGPRLLGLGARRIEAFDLFHRSDRIAWKLPVSGWAISRRALDDALLALARDAGAEVFQPATIRDVAYTADSVRLRVTDGAEHRADLVIHADGSGRHDPAGPIHHDPRYVAAKCHFHAAFAPPGRVGIRSARGAYIGTIRIEGEESTCALVAHRDLVRAHRGDFNSLLDAVWPGRDWTDRPDWIASPLPRSGYVHPGDLRSFRIGNAAAAVDPIGGEGIASALWAGARLGELLTRSPNPGRAALAQIHTVFARDYQRRLRTRLPSCRAAAWALMRPGLVGVLGPVLRRPAISIRPWYRLTGKPV